ncbi:MAG: FadR family transcriptional regulator [Myxococcales bacterium]|nr:FadR family transcriptional regulator [Myxococcales bacterium]
MPALTKFDQVKHTAARLRSAILCGEFAVNTALPDAQSIANENNVTEQIVREAFRDLQALNLVEILPDGRAVVQQWRRSGELPILPYFFLESPDPAEKASVVEELLHIRRVVLGEAAAQAAEHALADDLRRLDECIEAMRVYRGDTHRLVLLDLDFHEYLLDASHSLSVRWMANSLIRVYREFIHRYPGIWRLSHDHFTYLQELMTALRGGDPEETRAVVQRHLETSDQIVSAMVRMYAKGIWKPVIE